MPGLVGITVAGGRIVRPGVVTSIDASAMVPNRPGSPSVAGVLGATDGGIPNIVYSFSSYAEALGVLRGGTALSYLRRIFSPSPDIPGASLVRFVRIGAPTRSTATASGVVFTSTDYGRHTQGISLQIAVGVTTPWAVTVRKRLDGYAKTYNVGNAIEVMSTATTPKIVFDHTTKQAFLYESAAIVATLEYPSDNVTLANLIAFVNARALWTARLKVGGDPSMPVRYMDNPILASAPAITGSYTAIPASQGMLIWSLATQDPMLSGVESAVGTYATLSVVAETYLASGTGGATDTMVSGDWTTGLTAIAPADIQNLFLCTTDSAAQALAYQHVLDSRTVVRKRYRIFYTGGAAGQTSAQAIAAVPGFDGPAVYCWNGTSVANPITGLAEQLGGLGVAAQVCGMACGTYASEPITNKPLVAASIEFPSPTDTEIDQCLVAGVTPVCLDPVTGRPTVVQALTTWQGGANVAYRKLQGLRIQDAIHRGFQAALSRYIGYPLDLTTGQMIKADVAKFLDNSVRTAQNPGGFLTPGFANGREIPAWEHLTVSGDGMELWDIAVECHPVGETAYIRVAVKLTPAPIAL